MVEFLLDGGEVDGVYPVGQSAVFDPFARFFNSGASYLQHFFGYP